MTMTPLILILAAIAQDKPKTEAPEDQVKRPPIVDRLMPGPDRFFDLPGRPAEVNAQRDQQVQELLARKRAAAAAPRNRPQLQIHVMGRPGAAMRSITIEQTAPKLQERDGELDPPEPALAMQMGFNLQDSVLEIENFDRWVFGDGFDEEGRRARLQSRLSEKIDQVIKNRDINERQLQKLRLAGNGDIKRYLDRVQARRPEFEEARKNFQTGMALLQELEPLSTEFQVGPFGNDSFFAKTLKKIEGDPKGVLKDE